MADNRDSEARRLAGSKRGADTVREAFSEVITRKRYAELVGIHKTTLRRWEQEGVVVPSSVEIRGIATNVFRPEDVEFGRQLSRMMRERSGYVTLPEAADLVRRQSS